MGAGFAAGYHGPGPLAGGSALTGWTLDLPAVLAVAAAALWYHLAARRARWPLPRVLAFDAGLLTVLLATCWVPGRYAHVLFHLYAVQACVLLLVAPLLLGAGAPVALAGAGRPRVARPLLRVLELPGLGPLLLVAVTALVFFTPVLELTLRHQAAYQLLHLGLLATGLVMALPITDEGVTISSLGYAAMLGLGLVEFLLDAVPGIVLRLHHSLLAPAYWLGLHRPWGPSPIGDQHLAGAWLWFFAEAGDLPFIVVLLVAWVRSDAREAAAADSALDLASLERPLPTDVPPGTERPWWESDASVFGERRAARKGWGPAAEED